MKRQLTDEEKKFTNKNLENLKTELEYKQFLLQDTKYQLALLDQRTKWQIYEATKKLNNFIKDLKNQIAEDEFTINQAEEQIKNGVEVKKQ